MQSQRLGSTFCRGFRIPVPSSLIDPHGLNSALVGKHLLLTCPASAGLFLRCRHSNQPPAARLKGVGEPTGALRERQVGNPGGGRKSLASWRGFFCRSPRAWRNLQRGSTFSLRACRHFGRAFQNAQRAAVSWQAHN